MEGNDTSTVSYTYGNSTWADLLTAYDGHAIAYEGQTYNTQTGTVMGTVASGNPINWYNGNSYTDLNWEQGRRLESITKGSNTYSYEYDMSGIRSAKVADGLRHEYVTQSGRVVRESVYALNSTTGEYTEFQYVLDFTYDEAGHPLTIRQYTNETQTDYNTYHYVLNAQGDVIKLIDQDNGNLTTCAEYTYDAWGNLLSSTGSLANVNPLRYRGYYYDTETGFYYLQSRYYDPIVKRFLNADSYTSTGQGFLGYNMFAYCNNQPLSRSDSEGGYPVFVDEKQNQNNDSEEEFLALYYASFGKEYDKENYRTFSVRKGTVTRTETDVFCENIIIGCVGVLIAYIIPPAGPQILGAEASKVVSSLLFTSGAGTAVEAAGTYTTYTVIESKQYSMQVYKMSLHGYPIYEQKTFQITRTSVYKYNDGKLELKSINIYDEYTAYRYKNHS